MRISKTLELKNYILQQAKIQYLQGHFSLHHFGTFDTDLENRPRPTVSELNTTQKKDIRSAWTWCAPNFPGTLSTAPEYQQDPSAQNVALALGKK